MSVRLRRKEWVRIPQSNEGYSATARHLPLISFGILAHLGERYHGMVKVMGSSPVGSTKFEYFCAPMVKGISQRSSKPLVQVRILVGVPILTVSAAQ